MSKEIEVGAWNKLPHYAVIGHPQRFYVWVNEGNGNAFTCSSDWIKGKAAFELFHELKQIKDKKVLVARIKEIYNQFRKMKC